MFATYYRYRTWLIKYFFINIDFLNEEGSNPFCSIEVKSVKELGEHLSFLRKENGVSIEEASHDLGITPLELESIENGNLKVFKDVYELKKIILNYAKYLGVDEDKIIDEFNDFLFEKTSKISKKDIEELEKKETSEEKVSSPYTKVGKTRYDYAPIVFLIVSLIFISLVVYLVLSFLKKDDDVVRELRGKEEYIYEYTK